MKLKAYPEYKESEIPGVGEIPANWSLNKFKNIFEFSKIKSFEKNPVILSLTKKGIKKRDISSNEGQLAASYDGYHKVEKNDIVMNPMDLISGFVGCSDIQGIISPAYYILKVKTGIDPKYYNYYLQKHYYEEIFFPFAEGVSTEHRWTLKKEDLMNFKIIVPPLKEQSKIHSFLDKKTSEIDLTIEKDTRLIELLKEKRTALINHVVTKGLDPTVKMKDSGVEWIGKIPENWEVNKTKEITNVNMSNVDKKSKENEPEVLLCNYTDVYNNEFITSKLDFMKATASIEQVKKLSLQKGDVIITKDSETQDDIAVPALVEEDLENVVCGYHLALIRPYKHKIIGDFLFRLLQSSKINDQFVVAANGVTRFGISTYPIKNSYLTLPSLDQQELICKYLNQQSSKIDLTIEKIGNNIELIEEYKKSLIHHVVTGKVDVNEVAV